MQPDLQPPAKVMHRMNEITVSFSSVTNRHLLFPFVFGSYILSYYRSNCTWLYKEVRLNLQVILMYTCTFIFPEYTFTFSFPRSIVYYIPRAFSYSFSQEHFPIHFPLNIFPFNPPRSPVHLQSTASPPPVHVQSTSSLLILLNPHLLDAGSVADQLR